MAAYASAVSLSKTLSKLENNPNYPYPQIAELLEGIHSLKSFLVDNRDVKRYFETHIRGAIYEVQDMIESHMSSAHLLHPSEAEISRQTLCGDLERSMRIINLIVQIAKSEEFSHLTLDRKISNSIWKKNGEINRVDDYKLVGRGQEYNQLMYRLMKGSAGLEVLPIVGIAGMGKTALAEFMFQKQEIDKHFGIRTWAKIPIEYQKREVLLRLLRFIRKSDDGMIQKTEEELAKEIYNSLRKKRYLVVLDDIRDVVVWNDLKELFPDFHNGSRVLLTARNVPVGLIAGTPLLLERVSDEDSLSLLESIVFDGGPCPKEFVVIAIEITESCRGLPYAVVIAGRLLICAELSAEYWRIVLSSIIKCENYVDLIEALVCLTYKHLPQQLKACILYMAMFPYEYDIHLCKLMDLWIAEGFIEMDTDTISLSKLMDLRIAEGFVEMQYAGQCVMEFLMRHLIYYVVKIDLELETIRIADEALHDFVMRTAKEEKFFSVINKDTDYVDSLQEECITYNLHRRLFIRKNIVPFVIHNNHSNTSISTANSLLYYGPEQQYPLNAWLDFKFLKVLDALKIRFYRFPPEILKLVQSRYLALSYNGQLPSAVCKLQYLQFLIVIRYLSVKHSGAPSYLPMEIWNMKELRHLQVEGSDIPDIPSDTNLKLENLLKLSGVSVHSCTLQILERIPNLIDLGIQIESLPEDESLSFFTHLHILNNLIIFKCFVMYPSIESQAFPCFIPSFPSTLENLTLGGCGLPWEYMSVIAALPNLKRLMLQNYAFQGPVWEVKKDEFLGLSMLLLEDMDLKTWILADGSCFPMMAHFSIRHCYKLQGIPYAIGDIPTLQVLEVVDCSTSAMESALKIKEEKFSHGKHSFSSYSSRDD